MTRRYEALFILKPGGTEQDLSRSAAHLEDPIRKVGGQIERAESLGRRRLAFRISRQSEGHYHLVRFSLPTARVSELERFFRLNEGVVRFLILTAEEVAAEAQPAAPARAAVEPGRAAGVAS
jgi:small subunit ribosomal protein S6